MTNLKRIFTVLIAIAMLLSVNSVVLADDAEKININTAPLEELIKLKGIGQKYAQQIINYRENAGSFKIPEDIMKVKGIGLKTLEFNKDRIKI